MKIIELVYQYIISDLLFQNQFQIRWILINFEFNSERRNISLEKSSPNIIRFAHFAKNRKDMCQSWALLCITYRIDQLITYSVSIPCISPRLSVCSSIRPAVPLHGFTPFTLNGTKRVARAACIYEPAEDACAPNVNPAYATVTTTRFIHIFFRLTASPVPHSRARPPPARPPANDRPTGLKRAASHGEYELLRLPSRFWVFDWPSLLIMYHFFRLAFISRAITALAVSCKFFSFFLFLCLFFFFFFLLFLLLSFVILSLHRLGKSGSTWIVLRRHLLYNLFLLVLFPQFLLSCRIWLIFVLYPQLYRTDRKKLDSWCIRFRFINLRICFNRCWWEKCPTELREVTCTFSSAHFLSQQT